MTTPFAQLRRASTAARLAWRELSKDPRQGLLVALLVALPATVLMTVGVVSESQQPTAEQHVTAQLGSTEAWVHIVGPAGAQVTQRATDPTLMTVDDGPDSATSAGSWEESRDVTDLLPAGTRTLQLFRTSTYVEHNEAAGTFDTIVGPVWDPAFRGLYDVTEGSMPGDGGVMVSTALAERWQLAVGDDVAVGREPIVQPVVGIVDTPLLPDQETIFGTAHALAFDAYSGVIRPEFFTYVPDLVLDWDAVKALNADGVAVFSRAVAEDPPQEYVDLAAGVSTYDTQLATNTGITAGLGLLEVVLLAGAAFTVSLRRRQERLALLAATGADRSLLVGVSLWNGAFLGAAGGLIGIPLGVVIGAIWLRVMEAGSQFQSQVWGFHIAWWQVGAILAFTTMAGALAALVPAVVASRVDVMAALRGSRKPVKPRRLPAVLGVVLMVAGVSILAYALHLRELAWDSPMSEANEGNTRADQATLWGVLALFMGAIAVVPVALRGLARALSPLGVGVRIASRDAARQVGRTVPVVAAIAVTVMIMGNAALEELRNAPYDQGSVYRLAHPGDAVVGLGVGSGMDMGSEAPYGDPSVLAQRVAEVVDGVEAIAIEQVGFDQNSAVDHTVARMPAESMCPMWNEAGQFFEMASMTQREMAMDPRCQDFGGSEVYDLAVGGAKELEYLLDRPATDAERDMLASGGAVAFNPLLVGPDAQNATVGSLQLETWQAGDGAFEGGGTPEHQAQVPVMVGTSDAWGETYAAILSPAAAATVDAQVHPGNLFFHKDDGFSDEDQDRAQASLAREGDFDLWVEPVPEWNEVVTMWGALIGTVLVAGAATGLALGLARADARRDDVTLASLGASPHLARVVAAWQGGLLVSVAVWIGMACAVVLDYSNAQARLESGSLVWEVVVVALLVPPLIVAGAAWLMTRSPKPTHYRLAA